MRSHSSEIIRALASSASISSCYPQSFRFVIFLDNSLMLFTPHTDTTAVVVLRGDVKMLHKAYSQMRDEEGQGQGQEEEKEEGQGNLATRADSSEFEFVNPQHSPRVSPQPRPPVAVPIPAEDLSKQRRPGGMSRRHSSSDVQTPRPANLRAESKLGFKTLPLLKPPKTSPERRPPVEMTLTPPLVTPLPPVLPSAPQ
jgi:hypothetical protein